jgi:FkbM family methyltransferase
MIPYELLRFVCRLNFFFRARYDFLYSKIKDFCFSNIVDLFNIQYRKGSADEGIIREILISNVYLRHGFIIKKNDIVVDIGAQIGIFTLMAAGNATKGHVYSYEPMKKNFQYLKKNIERNKLSNVSIFNLGVLDKTESIKLFLSETCTGSHSIIPCKKQKRSKFEIINCIGLNEIFQLNKIKKCDFLKIDCEGSEYKILFNTSKDIFSKIRRIAMEYHLFENSPQHRHLKKFLEKNGFEVIMTKPIEMKMTKAACRYIGMIYATNKKIDI